MSDDRLLHDLGQLAREQEASRLGERWDRFSHGDLSPEEEAELRALADGSPEAHEAYEAFRPLGPEFQAAVVQKIQQAQAVETPPTPVLPFRRLISRIAGWSSLAASVAAAVLVFHLGAPVPLPEYAPLSVTGGVSASRGEGAETGTFAPGDRIEVVLQPRTAVEKEQRLEAGCFLTREGEVRRLEVRSEIVPSGSIRMTGTIPANVQPGNWTLWAVASRAGDLPGPEELRSQAGNQVRRRNWVALSKEVHIQPRSE